MNKKKCASTQQVKSLIIYMCVELYIITMFTNNNVFKSHLQFILFQKIIFFNHNFKDIGTSYNIMSILSYIHF